MDIITLVLLSIFSNVLPYIWTLPFLLIPFIRLFKTTQNDEIRKLSKLVVIAGLYENNNPLGLVIGKYFLGYLHEEKSERGGINKTFYILARKSFYNKIKISNKLDNNCYKNVVIEGDVWRPNINPTINKIPGKLRDWQQELLNEVIEYNLLNGSCTILLAGKPNTGKSTFGAFLAAKLKTTLINNYQPTKPFSLSMIKNKLNHSDRKPLIVNIDEIDSILNGFKYTDNKHVIPTITSFADWNTFISGILTGNYGNIILVASTNINLNDLDSGKFIKSCTREGRFIFRRQID